MSILCSNDKGWVISHYDYTKKIYTNVLSHSGIIDLAYDKNLFNIITPLMRDEEAQNFLKILKSKKVVIDKINLDTFDNDELLALQLAYKQLLDDARKLNFFIKTPSLNDYYDNNRIARKLVDNFFETINDLEVNTKFQGGNINNYPLIVNIERKNYLVPGFCSFYSYPIEDATLKLNANSFDFILIDPPWWNKFVRRKKARNFNKSYSMLHNDIIQDIPISNFLNESGLVGVWCTNSPTHLAAVKNFLIKWDLEFVAEWYWVKVTECGDLICSLTGKNGKKPFERILFGARKHRDHKNPENHKVIMSVPSAVHSHKPPLSEIISSYLPKNPNCLELFARYLLPGWTSIGNQVLLLQSLSLYESTNNR